MSRPLDLGFRAADPTDSDRLVAFMQDLAIHDGDPFDAAGARSASTALLDDPTFGRVWVIGVAGQPVGYAVLTLGFGLKYHGRDAFVDVLFVDLSWRGQGIGRAALPHLETCARELGVRALHLEVKPSNRPAQRVYRRAGFHDHDRYLMTKLLA